jgi:hypothetical protein
MTSTEVEEVKRLLTSMNEVQQRQILQYLRELLPKHPVEDLLMISADGMLEALNRAGDFTIRMIRGVFAEAAFAADVLPTLPSGWREVPINGDPPYDFLLTDLPEGATPPASAAYAQVKVQVKMQRSQGKKPLYASELWKTRKWPSSYFVVEIQKSRKGEKKGESTRPYRFGEFDILAVSLGPARGRWSDFIYTVERWLLPASPEPNHILTFQPVSPVEDEDWTTDFMKAVKWLRSGQIKRITGDLPKAGAS